MSENSPDSLSTWQKTLRVLLPLLTIAVGVQLLATLAVCASLAVSFHESIQLTLYRKSDGSTVHLRLEDGRVALGTWWLKPEERSGGGAWRGQE